ncbi:MAG: PPC domain-containing protein [Archangium sp.]|nr:PPC domain-containing protein [Archangium sp.]
MRVAVVFTALLLCACPQIKPTEDAGKTPECTQRSDCDAGLVCTMDSVCATCSTTGQCSVKEECNAESRLCTLRAGWGTQCAVNDDCQAGSWCKQGLCQARSEVSLCAGGMSSECPQGERCNQINLVCEEDLGCSTSDDCSAGEICNTGSRACQPRCTVDTQATVCNAGQRCVDEKCVQCASDAECGAGLSCDPAGNCSAGSRCYTDRDGPVPLVCLVQTGSCLPRAPACRSDDNCASNQRCDVASGRCIPRDCQPDRYEPNNDETKAFGVAPGPYRDLTLCSMDVDWYSISLARGDLLGVNVDADPFSENNFTTVVRDSTGRTVSGGHLLTSYVAPLPATYYVVVSTIDPFQPYDVTFLKSRGTPCDDDALEPNDSPGQPTLLNNTTTADGRICPQDQDYFRITVPAMKDARASLINYNAGNGLLRLCMFQSDGTTLLGCSSDLMPSMTAPAVAITGPSIVLRVVGDTSRIANSYTLSVEFP